MGETISIKGLLAGLCGYSGVTWEKVKINSSDQLEVEVKTIVLPDDAATEANQELILAELESIESGVQLRKGNHVTAFYSAVPGNTSGHVLVSVSGVGVLDWITLGSNHSSTYFSVVVDTDVLYTVDVATPAVQGYIRPVYFQYGEKVDSLFKLTCYDTDNNRFGVALARPVWFNTSLVVNYGAGSAAAKVSIALGYHLA